MLPALLVVAALTAPSGAETASEGSAWRASDSSETQTSGAASPVVPEEEPQPQSQRINGIDSTWWGVHNLQERWRNIQLPAAHEEYISRLHGFTEPEQPQGSIRGGAWFRHLRPNPLVEQMKSGWRPQLVDRSGQELGHRSGFVFRGQSPNYDEDPQTSPNLAAPPTFWGPTAQAAPFGIPGVNWPDSGMMAPNGWPGGPAPNSSVIGVNGPQPYRFGWQTKWDIGYLPSEGVSRNGALGSLGVFEMNLELRYTTPTPAMWIFSFAPQFNLRLWDGPGRPQLDGEADRFGWDFRLTSPTYGMSTFEVGFNPSIASDFERSPGSDAWMFDGHGALMIRTSPRWLVVIGAQFWDRVNDQVLPYGGLVYTPNEVFEARLLFPRADISTFLGAPWGVPQWLYVAGEYHIEAWEVASPIPGGLGQDQMEIEDWRVLVGVRSEYYGVTSFLEAGWVFGRHADFKDTVGADYDLESGFIARFGMRW